MTDKRHPLLTHNQLVDWLIYHRPLSNLKFAKKPFMAVHGTTGTMFPQSLYVQEATPWRAYNQLARLIKAHPHIHREITDLYWYWTI